MWNQRGKVKTYEAWSHDNRYGLVIHPKEMKQALSMCSKSKNIEIGGVLIGYYSSDNHCATVTAILPPPKDSKRASTSFYRGVQGLQTKIKSFWKKKKRQHYIGEWHYHPNASPRPSKTDISQMASIAIDQHYECPEPIMLIFGGNSETGFAIYSAIVNKESQLILLTK